MTDWKKYERFVAKLQADIAGDDTTVIPNAKLTGVVSAAERQIDVLIDARFDDDTRRRTIVDAKRHKRPIDVKQVEEFEGMMKDVRAQRGILVCPHGHTKAALRRAQDAISISLVTLDELESFDPYSWESCSHRGCKGWVLWDATPGVSVNGIWALHATSKCDECRRFNVWCWGCGAKFALNDEDEHQCACKGPWIWLTAIEADAEAEEEVLNTVWLLLVFDDGSHEVIDRRPLR